MKKILCLLTTCCIGVLSASAQVFSGASTAVATAVPHTTVPYRIEDKGIKLPDISWGLDLAWLDEGNLARGVNYAGEDMIDIVRLSFQTTYAVTDGTLAKGQRDTLNLRTGYVKKWAPKAAINLNSDQEAGVIDWYHVYKSEEQVDVFAPRWAALIAATKSYVEKKGLKVVSVSPFNEPDYGESARWGWQQGSKAEMREICRLLREDAKYKDDFKDVLLCGGNTLNCDPAWAWYEYSRDYLDEGNTHQLAGSFDSFASFYQKVKADGKTGVGDELHNTMECMVGSEYGLTKGIWWGTCEHTRSQFMKASRGTRMGYAENRDRWTAAGVYRYPEGYREGCQVQGFVGTSERQAGTTTFRFAAKDQDVFYNGIGPTREYVITTPGWPNGAGYDTEDEHYCTNAEGLVNIQGGDDIMPPLPTEKTTYKIVNRLSGHLLAPESNAFTIIVDGREEPSRLAQMKQLSRTPIQTWEITPFATNVGGDYAYYHIANAKADSMRMDVKNWSFDNRADVIMWANKNPGTNEQWFFEYAGDGYFYIRNRHSALYLQTNPYQDGEQATETQLKVAGRIVNQGVFTGEAYQQWKLVPADVTVDATAPAAPKALTATPQPASVRLEWTAPSGKDLKEYIVLRSTDRTNWNTVHPHVPTTAYVDNTVATGTTYYYKVQAVDKSLNRSGASEAVSAAATDERACIMQIPCDSLWDTSVNGNHAALYGKPSYTTGKVNKALMLTTNSATRFVQLPATIANHRQLSIATWVNMRATTIWQRIFDFGNDTDHYVFLTNNSDTGNMRVAIKNAGSEQVLDIPVSLKSGQWYHLAVTFSDDVVTVYVDGQAVASSTDITIRPADFKPIFNYIGRSQFTNDPMLRAYIDDFRIYNYPLAADEVAAIYGLTDGIEEVKNEEVRNEKLIFDLSGRQIVNGKSSNSKLTRGIYIINGKKVLVK